MIQLIADEIREWLSQESDLLWWPGLAAKLENYAADLGFLNIENYSTEQFLSAQGSSPKNLITIESTDFDKPLQTTIEIVSELLNKHFSDRGLVLENSLAALEIGPINSLKNALALIGVVPTLATTVHILAKSIHVIRSSDAAYDISFSDPKIPFSIFVSVPSAGSTIDLRIAEAIIHETMHLQLSLVERFVDMAKPSGSLYYSPWKKEARPVSGVLHAMYVFAVISQWLAELPINSVNVEYAQKRREQIKKELYEVDLPSCLESLTEDGRRLLKRTASIIDATI